MKERIMSRAVAKNPVQVKPSDAYMRLIRRFPLRPIRNEADYDAATAVLEILAIRAEDDLDQGECDYLAVLSDLIEAYEEHQCPMPPDARPAHEKLKSLVEDQGMTSMDLAKILGVSRSLASLVLSGKRRITADHAKALGERFKLEPGYFL
jgi:HTH-type transcriptional regulator/antitoxin HigA